MGTSYMLSYLKRSSSFLSLLYKVQVARSQLGVETMQRPLQYFAKTVQDILTAYLGVCLRCSTSSCNLEGSDIFTYSKVHLLQTPND